MTPSEWSNRRMRCGSRPCSTSSTRMTVASFAALRCNPATNSRVDPVPSPRSGTPVSLCREIVPPLKETEWASKSAFGLLPTSMPRSRAVSATIPRVADNCFSAMQPNAFRAVRAASASAPEVSAFSSESLVRTDPRRHAKSFSAKAPIRVGQSRSRSAHVR